MSHLATVILATRASANALQAMGRHARDARDAGAILAYNARMVACGRIAPASIDLDDSLALRRKIAAESAYKRAARRYQRAQESLESLPI